MADFISQVGGANKPETSTSQRTPKVTSPESDGVAANQQPARTTTVTDEVVLSEISQKAISDPGFDQGKVEAIKLAISEGNYPLDARKIAESYSSLERLIGDTAN